MAKPVLPNKSLAWPVPWRAVELVALKEGLRLRAYLCPAGVPTIGWGETEGVSLGMTWTKAQADERLCAELGRYADRVRSLCRITPSDTQLGALVCLAYNIGLTALAKSSVLKAHNRGDFAAAARAFGLWNKAKVQGKLVVVAGLTTRRAAEAALYLEDAHDEVSSQAMPQAVAAESSLAQSPIAQSGAGVAGAGALTLLSSVKDQATLAGDTASTLGTLAGHAQTAVQAVSGAFGVPTPWLLGAALLAAGLAVLAYRFKQRRDGWA